MPKTIQNFCGYILDLNSLFQGSALNNYAVFVTHKKKIYLTLITLVDHEEWKNAPKIAQSSLSSLLE